MTSNEALEVLILEVEKVIDQGGSEKDITARIADRLRESLAAGLVVDEEFTRPDPSRYLMYPLHVDAEKRFSIASAVWNVGQSTPVHGHETWGVVGIYRGVEDEVAFVKPTQEGQPLVRNGEASWHPGEVTVCCTTDDDVHMVSCGSDEPCIGVHVYGADIGVLSRRKYEEGTGAVSWFVSDWAPFETRA